MDKEQIQRKLAQIQALIGEVNVLLSSEAQTAPSVQSGNTVPAAALPVINVNVASPQPDAVSNVLESPVEEQVKTESSVGKVGVFDGEFVIMDNGKKFQVPPNYVSKTKLVVGDKLKLLKEGDYNEFKIVEQVERVETKGILTKKDNQWTVLLNDTTSPNGQREYRVVSAAIRFFNGEIGDTVEIVLPADYLSSIPAWAAVKNVEQTGERGREPQNPNPYAKKPETPKQEPEPVVVSPAPLPPTPPVVVQTPQQVVKEPTVSPQPAPVVTQIPEPVKPIVPDAQGEIELSGQNDGAPGEEEAANVGVIVEDIEELR